LGMVKVDGAVDNARKSVGKNETILVCSMDDFEGECSRLLNKKQVGCSDDIATFDHGPLAREITALREETAAVIKRRWYTSANVNGVIE
jgi:hypothetical protein